MRNLTFYGFEIDPEYMKTARALIDSDDAVEREEKAAYAGRASALDPAPRLEQPAECDTSTNLGGLCHLSMPLMTG